MRQQKTATASGSRHASAPASPLAWLPPGTPRPEPEPASPVPLAYVIDGPRLRQLRRQHGMSQERLAWDSGVGLTTLARLERQPRPRCRPTTLVRLARTLGENPAAIIIRPADRPARLHAVPGDPPPATA